jgi:isoleucyl-tRNA synthetase
LVKNIKADFKVLGKKYGKLMKAVADAISKFSQSDIRKIESEGISLPACVG